MKRCAIGRRMLLAAMSLLTPVLMGQATAQVCVPPPAGLVSWWPGEANANDIVGGNHGSLQNGTTFAPGFVGQSLSFDGVNDYVEIADAANLEPGTRFTWDMWLYPTSTSSFGMLIDKEGVAFAYIASYYIAILDRRVRLFSSPVADIHDFNGQSVVETTNQVIVPNVWQHLAVVYDGSLAAVDRFKVFVNGVQMPLTGGIEGYDLPPSSIADIDDPTVFGVYRPGISRDIFLAYAGLMDEVEFFNVALTSAQIQALYAAGSAGKCRYSAEIRPPVAVDGSSVFNARRGVVPIKFTLAANDVPTCQLPPATISVFRTSGNDPGPINGSEYLQPSDAGSSFRIDSCQYVYNLGTSSLGVGSYRVEISIGGRTAGSGEFSLK